VSVSSRLRYLSVDVLSVQYSGSWQQDLETSFAEIIPILAESQIICLEISCCPLEHKAKNENVNMSDHACKSNTVAEHKSCEAIRPILPAAVASITTLKYLSLKIYAWYRHPIDVLSGHPLEERAYWWSYDGSGVERIAMPMDATRGRRIATHLRSPAYDHTKAFADTVVL